MKISPQNDCKWTYRNNRLSVFLTSDENVSYIFETHYRVSDLYVRPADNSSFCIQDACLLTEFQEGLSKVNLNDSACLDLGLNALACSRFVRSCFSTSRYFYMSDSQYIRFNRGDVVSLYAKNGNIADCIVIDPCDGNSLTRLMLLNPSFTFDETAGLKCVLGSMIRVNPACVYDFRCNVHSQHARYA